MSYSLHPQAEQVLMQNPNLGTPASGPFRIYPLRRFPYSVVYRSANEGLRILVVAHQHRRPGYWRGRA